MADLIDALMAAHRAKDETSKEQVLEQIRQYENELQINEPTN